MIGEKIKLFRKQKKLTQEQLGQLVDLSGVAIMRYEKGQREPNRETIEKIAKVLEVAPSQIYGWDDFDEKYNQNGKLAKDVNNIEETKNIKENLYSGDVAKKIKALMEELGTTNKALMFDGQEIDEETKKLLKDSLENSYKMAKMLNKKEE